MDKGNQFTPTFKYKVWFIKIVVNLSTLSFGSYGNVCRSSGLLAKAMHCFRGMWSLRKQWSNQFLYCRMNLGDVLFNSLNLRIDLLLEWFPLKSTWFPLKSTQKPSAIRFDSEKIGLLFCNFKPDTTDLFALLDH